MKDTKLRCYHTVKVRNLLPVSIIQHLAESKKRTEMKKAIKHLKRGILYPRGRALVKISS